MHLEGTITHPASKNALAHFADAKAEDQHPRQASRKPPAQRYSRWKHPRCLAGFKAGPTKSCPGDGAHLQLWPGHKNPRGQGIPFPSSTDELSSGHLMNFSILLTNECDCCAGFAGFRENGGSAKPSETPTGCGPCPLHTSASPVYKMGITRIPGPHSPQELSLTSSSSVHSPQPLFKGTTAGSKWGLCIPAGYGFSVIWLGSAGLAVWGVGRRTESSRSQPEHCSWQSARLEVLLAPGNNSQPAAALWVVRRCPGLSRRPSGKFAPRLAPAARRRGAGGRRV